MAPGGGCRASKLLSGIPIACGESPVVPICFSSLGVNSIIMQFEFSHMCDMMAKSCIHACGFRLEYIVNYVRMWPWNVHSDILAHDM